MSEERDDIVVLLGEDGEEAEFEFLDKIDLDDKSYVVLVPLDSGCDCGCNCGDEEGHKCENESSAQDDDSDDECEIVILRIEKNEDGEDSFASIEDEDELNRVFEEFRVRYEEDEE
jgi:uncharacterized protein YrzB (UPF0473 family)